MSGLNITFIIHDRVGGVAYMNHQIIEHGNLMDHFRVRIILFKKKEDRTARFSDRFKAHEMERFDYSEHENYYLVLKKFNKVINKNIGIVVTNDGIELQAIKLFGTKSWIYSIVHDFYNLQLAIGNFSLTDVFICHTEIYAKALKSSGKEHPRVDYLPHGVIVEKEFIKRPIRTNEILKIVFIGRFVESKGVLLLHEIEQGLKERKINVEWIIIGSGNLDQSLKKQWKDAKNVTFIAPLENKEVMNIAKEADLFLSPSIFEGYGIALLEAMSCGASSVYDLPVGIASILPKECGFRIMQKGIAEFVDMIQHLNLNRDTLIEMKLKAHQFVAGKYDILETSKQYCYAFLSNNNTVRNEHVAANTNIKSFGVFDKWFLPNALTKPLKKIRNWSGKV